ncbi:hypothetical protein O6H91_Y125900 [Diphasiastrum complanatum]|nr:hypothetical protein O6H91_Y125900 [Diphasiastrum complanatum]
MLTWRKTPPPRFCLLSSLRRWPWYVWNGHGHGYGMGHELVPAGRLLSGTNPFNHMCGRTLRRRRRGRDALASHQSQTRKREEAREAIGSKSVEAPPIRLPHVKSEAELNWVGGKRWLLFPEAPPLRWKRILCHWRASDNIPFLFPSLLPSSSLSLSLSLSLSSPGFVLWSCLARGL